MRRRKFCKCGCGTSLTNKRRGAIWASEGCRKAFKRGVAPANADISRTRKPSGPQVALQRAIAAGERLALLAPPACPSMARQVAEREMHGELSERQRRQREQLAQRSTERKAA
jgi:hypothetical protein